MDIVKLVSQFVAPNMVAKLARSTGLPEALVQKGLSMAIPVVLAALLGKARKPGGADAIMSAIGQAPGGSEGLLADADSSATAGSNLLESLLGGDTVGTLANALGANAGASRAGAGSLLGTAGALALGALGKEAGGRGGAGILNLLESNRGAISAALPPDLSKALGAVGLMEPQPAAARPAPPPPPSAPPVPEKSGWMRWLLWLVAAALVAWLLAQWLMPAPPPPAPPPAPVPQATAPTPAPTPQATAPTPAANPLVVNGVDIGAEVREALSGITSAFGGITDAASAQSALPQLTAARDKLSGLGSSVSQLPETGKSALRALVSSSLPAIEASAQSLLANPAVSGVVKPVVDAVLATLRQFAA